MWKQTVKPLDLAISTVMSFSPPCLEEIPIFIEDIFSKNKFTISAFVYFSRLQNKQTNLKEKMSYDIYKDNVNDDISICLT